MSNEKVIGIANNKKLAIIDISQMIGLRYSKNKEIVSEFDTDQQKSKYKFGVLTGN